MAEVRKSTSKSDASESLTKHFERKEDWAAWLERNQSTSPGLWLQLAKKKSQVKGVAYQEAQFWL